MKNKVVITGVGLISPLGDSWETFLDGIYSRRSGISEVTLFDVTSYATQIAGEIGDFDAEKYLGKKGLRSMNRSTKLVLTASQSALANSNYPLKGVLDHDIGVVLGNTFGSLKSISEYDRIAILESPMNVSPTEFANCVINSAAGNVGVRWQAMCINITMSNGISSSLDALGYACDFINMDRAKMLIVGGVEELCAETFYGFGKSGLMALNTDASNSWELFANESLGIVLGEGSAIFTLETLAAAKERNAPIYAEVAGYGRYFNEGRNPVNSMVRCMEKALKDAEVEPSEIDVVIANTNGYQKGDCNELEALERIFHSAPEPVKMTSIKGSIGETYSASGAFQVLAALGMFERNEIPAVVGLKENFPKTARFEIVKENVTKPVKTVLVNAFGFSGSNASLVLKRIQG